MNEPGAADWPAFRIAAAGLDVTITDAQEEQLRRYLELLCEWNRRFNLTAIEDPQEILLKHFLDSLTCATVVDLSTKATLIDVGTGAGFPGLVLKIAFPHLQVTLLDSLRKRIGFLDRVVEELALEGVCALHARAEDAARSAGAQGKSLPAQPSPRLREQFDVVTSRAVARLAVLAEWTLPFARVGGALVAMKGPQVEAEVQEAKRAIRVLGGGSSRVREFTLPGSKLGRSLVLIPKVTATPPAYPRLPGTARKDPLR
jgi:16S rRNA (guanine527-N7)-methyltransferase